MSFKFKLVFRKKPGANEGKFYASVSSYAKVSEKQLSEEIGSLTALNRTNVRSWMPYKLYQSDFRLSHRVKWYNADVC